MKTNVLCISEFVASDCSGGRQMDLSKALPDQFSHLCLGIIYGLGEIFGTQEMFCSDKSWMTRATGEIALKVKS